MTPHEATARAVLLLAAVDELTLEDTVLVLYYAIAARPSAMLAGAVAALAYDALDPAPAAH